jgi:hypothetical protein
MQHSAGRSHWVSVFILNQKGNTLNTDELARNKFSALFAAHDAKDIHAAAQEQKPALKTNKKEAAKNVKPK